MLKKEFRITKAFDFKRLYQKGKFVNTDSFTLRVLPNRLSFSRFAVVVLKKHTKQAVKRNKIRRRIREIVRLNFDKINSGFDVIILTRRDLTGVNYNDLEKTLNNMLLNAGIQKK